MKPLNLLKQKWRKSFKMSYGLTDYDITAINRLFAKYQEVNKAVLYGSRAKGSYHRGSDIDLTLKGEGLNLTTLLKIETELDDLLLPYKIDLSIYDAIENLDLIDHIDRIGMNFYIKETL